MKFREALVLSLGMVAAAVIFGFFFYESRESGQTVKIVGTGTRGFNSDVIKWRLAIGRHVSPTEVTSGYVKVAKDVQALSEELIRKGLAKEEMIIQSVLTQPSYGNNGQVTGYTVQQGITVTSRDMSAVEKLAFNPGEILRESIILLNSNVEYYFSDLAGIKKELIAAAVKDARARAEVIALNSGTRIRGIQSARVGVFQITEPYSAEVTDTGIYNVNTKRKDVTVTVHAVFDL